MLAALITKRGYVTIALPKWKEGHFYFKDPDNGKDLFEITGDGEQWQLKACGWNQILDQGVPYLQNGSMIHVRLASSMEKAIIYAENRGKAYAKYASCLVSDYASYVIGIDKQSDIVLNNPLISARHAILKCQNGKWNVESISESLAVCVNGRRVLRADLKYGDVVSILNQKFIVLPGVLAMNAQNIVLEAMKGRFQSVKFTETPQDKLIGNEPDPVFFHRQPRFTGGLFEKDVSFIAPPEIRERAKRRESAGSSERIEAEDSDDTLLTYGPAVTSGLLMVLGGITNPVYGLGMLASSILFPSLRRRKEKEKRAEYERLQKLREEQKQEEEQRQIERERQEAALIRKKYKEYLRKLDRELDEINRKQTEQLQKFNRSAAEECSILQQKKDDLWNRRPEHSDFLDIRLGTGDIPVQANIEFPEEAYSDRGGEMYEMLREIKDKPRMLRQVPIMLQLGSYYSVGVSGPESLRENLVSQMILQLAMHIGYDELKICILGKLPKAMQDLKWLPHTWTDDHAVHMIASDKDELTRLLPELDKQLREHRTQVSFSEDYYSLRRMVFLITDEELGHSGMVMRLLFDHPTERVHVISAASSSRGLPRRTDLAIGLRPGKGRMLWQEGNKKQMIDFTPDSSVVQMLPIVVRMMANTRLDLRQEVNRMPDMLPFLAMYGVQDAAQLNILNRWRRSNPIRSLSAPIGVSEDGNICYLDLHENGDGPHGLVAGTTGSGKSEMLMNYILSMACNYAPHEVSFVLIDYKGGGMAQAFEQLPHTAGIITNLDGNEIPRSLMSLQSELERRQKLFADCKRITGVRNLDIYKYQQLFREQKVAEPLSHLIVITDEFAELKTQQSEFLEQLIRAARIGRSLGVHLILATQRPAGVVDEQIRSNSNFHICLRVQSQSDSREVINCDAAAHLTNPGSLYKQVGYGEVLSKAQSGYTGADYAPKSIQLPDCGVDVLDNMGTVLSHTELSLNTEGMPSQLEAITDYLIELGKRTGLTARKLWVPMLERKIPLSALIRKYPAKEIPWVINPLIGELDDPANQCRLPLYLHLSNGKNTIVYGVDHGSQLMLLGTTLEMMLLRYNARELNVYIADCADDGLMIYRDAPQVGDVISSDNLEKLVRLICYLEEQIMIRKRILGSALLGMDLSQRLKQSNLPNVLVIIHHVIAFQSLTEKMEERVRKLLVDGPRYGITFLATQESVSGLRAASSQHFPQKLVLQMNTDDDYFMLLGKTRGMKPAAVKGRGMVRNEYLYEFQIASPELTPNQLCEFAKKHDNAAGASEIRMMPEKVTVDVLQKYLKEERPWLIPVGLNKETIQPEYWNFKNQMVHMMIGYSEQTRSLMEGIGKLAVSNHIPVMMLDIHEDTGKTDGIKYVGKTELKRTIDEMFELCCRVYAAEAEGTDHVIPSADTLVLIPELSAVLKYLNLDKNKKTVETLEALLYKAREEYGWYFVIGDTVEKMSKHPIEYSFSNWFSYAVSTVKAIYLGGGLDKQSLIQVDSAPQGNTDFPQGYLVYNKKVHALQYLNTGEEGDNLWNM